MKKKLKGSEKINKLIHKNIWQDITRPGFRSEGRFTKQEAGEITFYKHKGGFNPPGQKVVLHRPEEMTPNRVPELWDDDIIKFKKYNKRKNELKSVAKIKKL